MSTGDVWPPTVGCAVEGCVGKHHAKGMCQKHYNQWRRSDDPSATTDGGAP